MITLAATKRTTESSNSLRLEDKIPAIYYGSGKEAVSITIALREFVKVWKEAGETTAVILDFGGEKVTTIIHDLQHHPVTNTPIHVDFLVIDMKKEIEVAIPIEFTGVAEAEKGNIGTIVKILHEVTVRALPNDLPRSLNVDITSLDSLESQIHVKDIELPNGVTLVTDTEEVVAIVAPFKEEELEEVAPVDLDAIEVEQKGKKEEEEPAAE